MQFLRWLRSASAYERASAAVAVLTLIFLAAAFAAPRTGVVRLPATPTPVTNHPVQNLYRVQRAALSTGWTTEHLRAAANAYAALGDLRNAAAYWERTNPDDPPTLRRLSEAYLELGDWPNALNALERLLALDSVDNSWAHFQLGLIRASFDPAAALLHLRAAEVDYGASLAPIIAALESNPSPVRVGIALADAELWPYAELAFSHAGDDALALAYAGLARDRQSKDGSAQIARAVLLEPQNPQVRFLEGLHWRQAGDYQASLNALIQATALDPENPALYAELASAYRLLGDLDSAERWYMQAVAVSNGDPRFRTVLDAFRAERQTLLEQLGLITDEPIPEATDSVPPP